MFALNNGYGRKDDFILVEIGGRSRNNRIDLQCCVNFCYIAK